MSPLTASVTEVSFSTFDTALAHAEQMIAEGADIIDIGGESTRPGGIPITPEEEIERVVPVIEDLVKAFRRSHLSRHNQV